MVEYLLYLPKKVLSEVMNTLLVILINLLCIYKFVIVNQNTRFQLSVFNVIK